MPPRPAQRAWRRFSWLVVLPSLFAMLVGLLWTRGERILGNDSFYYLHFAKSFRQTLPESFGSHWPHGYPLLGAVLSWIVGDTWLSLLLISGASLVACFCIVASMLDREEVKMHSTLIVLLAVAATPTISGLLFGTMSELTFSALVLGQAFAMAQWPSRRAVLMSVLLALASFGVRYVGLFMLLAVALWIVVTSRSLKEELNLAFAIRTLGLALTASLGMLWTNFRVVGHLSGGERDPAEGLASLPRQLAQLGLALPSSASSGQLSNMLGGAESALGLAAGMTVMTSCVVLIVLSYKRPRSVFSRPVSLLALTYLVSIALLRSLWSFDDLSGGRAIVPALFPLVFLAIERCRAERKWALTVGGTSIIVLGSIAAIRGVSPETHGDIRSARKSVAPRLTISSLVSANDAAISIAAYVSNPVVWSHEPTLEAVADADVLVVAAKRIGRFASRFEFDPAWIRFCETLQRNGDYELIQGSSASMVLLRTRSGTGRRRLAD